MTFLERQLEDPVRFRRLKHWFYAGLATLALTEGALPLVVEPDRAHFTFEDIPAWGSFFGLLACVVIIVFSKLLGKLWLSRSETYYERIAE